MHSEKSPEAWVGDHKTAPAVSRTAVPAPRGPAFHVCLGAKNHGSRSGVPPTCPSGPRAGRVRPSDGTVAVPVELAAGPRQPPAAGRLAP